MGYLIIDRENGGQMRSQMRNTMRGGYRHNGYTPMMRGDGYEHGYREDYKHGWEDSEDNMTEEVNMRRSHDSRGRFI